MSDERHDTPAATLATDALRPLCLALRYLRPQRHATPPRRLLFDDAAAKLFFDFADATFMISLFVDVILRRWLSL